MNAASGPVFCSNRLHWTRPLISLDLSQPAIGLSKRAMRGWMRDTRTKSAAIFCKRVAVWLREFVTATDTKNGGTARGGLSGT